MPTLALAAAKAHLSAVIYRVEQGEEIVIARRGGPVARILAEKPKAPADSRWIDEIAHFVDAQDASATCSVPALRAHEPY